MFIDGNDYGIIVSGGNGQGNGLNELNKPISIYINNIGI